VRVLRREIFSKLDTGRVRVLAAAIEGADGKIPTLVIVDEYHHAKSAALFGVLSDGLGPRNGQVVMISTAGSAADSPLGEIRSKAHVMEGFTRTGTHNQVRTREFAFHEWCLEPEADVEDMAVVKTANPAPWHTEDSLRIRKEEPEMTPWRWLRFACGIWTEGEEPGIDPPTWDALASPGMELVEKDPTWLAIHFGHRGESAALALVQVEGEQVRGKVIIQDTPTFAGVEQQVRDLGDRFQLEALIFDRRQFLRSSEILEAEGFTIIEEPQSHERMVLASQAIYKLIEEGRLHHDGSKALRAQVLACQVKETDRDWKYVASTRPIDGLLALAVASRLAIEMGPREYVM
jgi:phage terminase large subunit-like protein